jgi:hypothetical protein
MAKDKKSGESWARRWCSKMRADFRWFRRSRAPGPRADKRPSSGRRSRITSGSTRWAPCWSRRVVVASGCSVTCGAVHLTASIHLGFSRSSYASSRGRLCWSGITIRSTPGGWSKHFWPDNRVCTFFISHPMHPNSIPWKASGPRPKNRPPAFPRITSGSFIGGSIPPLSTQPTPSALSKPVFTLPRCLGWPDGRRHFSFNGQ